MKILLIGANGKMGRETSAYFDQNNIEYEKVDVNNRRKVEYMNFDVILDFSSKDALLDNLRLAYMKKCPIVIATTGHDKKNYELIKSYSRYIPIFLSSNFSVLMAILNRCLKSVKKTDGMDTVVYEVHHKHKKDKPSGSAKMLIKTLNKNKIVPKVFALRIGDVVGEHSVTFYLKDEKLTISHSAYSRKVFSAGAYLACKFIQNRKIGLYTMEDII